MLDTVKKEIDQKIKELDSKHSINLIETHLLGMLVKSSRMPNSSEQYACLSADIINFVLSIREERTISDVLLKISSRINQINS